MVYEGYWEQGRQMGLGKLTMGDGEIKEGFFMDDKILSKEQADMH